MSVDLKFVVVPGGAPDSLSVTVTAGNSAAPQAVLQRQVLALDAAKLEEFRRGELGAPELEQLTTAVNDWLLDAQVRTVLTNAFAARPPGPNGTGLRVTFVVVDAIRDAIAPIPMELLWHDTPLNPLVLRNDVESMAYLLSKAATAPESLATRNWPLKILIVRANPTDWGGKVPEVGPLRQHILKEAQAYGPGMVHVDVISSEGGAPGQASWAALRDHLKRTNDYNILVYLGHGELADSPTGGAPIGNLYMESIDGQGHQPVGAPQLAKLLSTYPIPLVILAGCVTATEPAGLTRRRGAEHGVAQALVNSSEAGVQMAVGMRMEVQGTTAMAFLDEFFSSLVKDAPGDLDCAVRKARNELFLQKGLYPPHWAAPVVFRAIDRMPGFDFLNQPVNFQVSGDMAKWLELRSRLWNRLPEALAQTEPTRLNGILEALDATETELRRDGARQGPLLMPRLARLTSGQPGIVEIDLVGALAVTKLCARLDAPAAVGLQRLKIDPAVRAAGFKLLTDQEDLGYFELHATSGAPMALPEGALVLAEVTPAGSAAVHPVKIELRGVEPRTPLWPGDNVTVSS